MTRSPRPRWGLVAAWVAAVALALSGCMTPGGIGSADAPLDEPAPPEVLPDILEHLELDAYNMPDIADVPNCVPLTMPLLTNDNYVAGKVLINEVNQAMLDGEGWARIGLVTVETLAGWEIAAVSMHADFTPVPTSPMGTATPAMFDHQQEFGAHRVTATTLAIPFGELFATCGSELTLSLHATVVNVAGDRWEPYVGAWAMGYPIESSPWGYWLPYELTCDACAFGNL